MNLNRRSTRLLLSAVIAMTVLGGGVATAAPSPGPTGQEGPQAAVPGYRAAPGTPTTAVTSPNASGRSATTQVATPAVTRSEMITRAKVWTNAGVAYSKEDYYNGYRTDCSGFVSMAWKLSESLTTSTLDQVSHRIDKDDLKAGDILLRAGVHVAIFEKWADAAHTEYYVYEQTPPKAIYHKISYPYYNHDGYLPYRYNNVIEDDGERATYPGLSTISRENGDLDVFATTSDGHLKHRHMEKGVWGCWATLPYGAKIKGDPAAIYTNGRIDVFALTTANRLVRLTWTTTNDDWYPWTDMGTDTFTSSPAVTSRWDGGIDVFVKNNANKIVYRHFDMATGWVKSWSPIGDNAATTAVSSAPAAVSSPDGSRMNVFARATDGSLLSLMWTSAGWYSWIDRGGNFTGRPAASTRGGNTVDVFLRGNDDGLFHRYSPDGADWSKATAGLGGHIYTSPAAVSMSGQRIDAFSRNNEGDLVRKTWSDPNDGWFAWAGHGAIGAPAC